MSQTNLGTEQPMLEPTISASYGSVKLETALVGPKRSPVGLGKFMSWIEEAKKVIINMIFLAALLLLAWTVVEAIRTEKIIVEPIGTPKLLKDLGYSEDVAGKRLAEAIQKINERATTRRNRNEIMPSSREIDVSVPGAGVSLSSFIRVVRQSIGKPQKRVAGEFLCAKEPCTLNSLVLRIGVYGASAAPQTSAEITGQTIEEQFDLAAERIMRDLNPYVLASYFYYNKIARKDEAIAVAKKMLLFPHPDRAWALNLMGLYHFDRREIGNEVDEYELDQSVAWFEKAIDEDKDFVVAYVNWGNVLRVRRDFDGAIAKYQKAVECDRKYSVTYANWGGLLLEMGDIQGAIAKFQEAIEYNSKYAFAYRQLGDILKNNGDIENAVVKYEMASALDPADASVYINRGISLNDNGDIDGAIDKYERAIALDSNYAVAYGNLGKALGVKNELDRAIKAYETYLRLRPDAENAQQIQDWIKEYKAHSSPSN